MAGAAFMAISSGPVYISLTGNNGGIGTSLSLNEPSDVQTGDMLLAVMGATGDTVTWTQPSGYTEHLDQNARPSLCVASERPGSGSDTWSCTGSPTNIAGLHICLRLAQFDTIGSVATITADGDLTIPGVTAAGGLLLAVVILDGDASATVSTPSGWTSIYNANSLGQRLAVFTKNVPVGATGDVVSTISGLTTGTAGGVLVAVK